MFKNPTDNVVYVLLLNSSGVMMSLIANTPKPPFYATIFTSHRLVVDEAYGTMVDRMLVAYSEN